MSSPDLLLFLLRWCLSDTLTAVVYPTTANMTSHHGVIQSSGRNIRGIAAVSFLPLPLLLPLSFSLLACRHWTLINSLANLCSATSSYVSVTWTAYVDS